MVVESRAILVYFTIHHVLLIHTNMGNKVTQLDYLHTHTSHDCLNAFCNHDKLFLRVRKRTQVNYDIFIIKSLALPFHMLHCL